MACRLRRSSITVHSAGAVVRLEDLKAVPRVAPAARENRPAIGRRAASPLLRRRSGRLRAPSRGELNPRLNTAAHTPSTSKCVAMPFAALRLPHPFSSRAAGCRGPPKLPQNMAGGRAGALPACRGEGGRAVHACHATWRTPCAALHDTQVAMHKPSTRSARVHYLTYAYTRPS